MTLQLSVCLTPQRQLAEYSFHEIATLVNRYGFNCDTYQLYSHVGCSLHSWTSKEKRALCTSRSRCHDTCPKTENNSRLLRRTYPNSVTVYNRKPRAQFDLSSLEFDSRFDGVCGALLPGVRAPRVWIRCPFTHASFTSRNRYFLHQPMATSKMGRLKNRLSPPELRRKGLVARFRQKSNQYKTKKRTSIYLPTDVGVDRIQYQLTRCDATLEKIFALPAAGSHAPLEFPLTIPFFFLAYLPDSWQLQLQWQALFRPEKVS